LAGGDCIPYVLDADMAQDCLIDRMFGELELATGDLGAYP
jgi:hypothetical protein